MSPYKGKAKSIAVLVPKHNSQRIGPRLTSQVEHVARKQKKRVDIKQTAYDPQSILAQAIDSASEWNSLLMTARAERGPQWDIGTQMFMVDEESDLFYDSTPLREYEKDVEGGSEDEKPGASTSDLHKTERGSMPPPPPHDSPHLRRMAQMPHTPQQAHSVPFSPRHHSSQFTPGPSGFSQSLPVTPQHGQQFFNGHGGMSMGGAGMSMGSPMGNSGIGMHMDGMSLGGMGMSGMSMSMGSPDMRRMAAAAAARRGPISMEDGFAGMH